MKNFGIKAKIKEGGCYNNIASSYIEKHHDKLVGHIRRQGVKGKAEDLLHDVYIVILEKEKLGEAFDREFFGNDDGEITTAQYVYGLINKYCKNKNYKDSVCETNSLGTYGVYAASYDEGEESDSMSQFQVAYMNASDADVETSALDVAMLVEEIETCIDIAEMRGVDMKNFFANYDLISQQLISVITNRKSKASTVFDRVLYLMNEHSEFKESLLRLIMTASDKRYLFDAAVAEVCK